MAQYISIFFLTILAAIFLYPANGRARLEERNQQKYLLVQISEPVKGKARQGTVGDGYLNNLGDLASGLAQGALSIFDSANQDNVKEALGPLFKPSAVPQPTNIGNTNTGNTG